MSTPLPPAPLPTPEATAAPARPQRVYFAVYSSWIEDTDELPRESQARLLQALLRYGALGEQPEELSPEESALFRVLRRVMDYDTERYHRPCPPTAPHPEPLSTPPAAKTPKAKPPKPKAKPATAAAKPATTTAKPTTPNKATTTTPTTTAKPSPEAPPCDKATTTQPQPLTPSALTCARPNTPYLNTPNTENLLPSSSPLISPSALSAPPPLLPRKEEKQEEESPTLRPPSSPPLAPTSTPSPPPTAAAKRNGEPEGSSRPESLDEVRNYWNEKAYESQPEEFYAYYEARHWLGVGQVPLQAWRRAAVAWERYFQNAVKPKRLKAQREAEAEDRRRSQQMAQRQAQAAAREEREAEHRRMQERAVSPQRARELFAQALRRCHGNADAAIAWLRLHPTGEE